MSIKMTASEFLERRPDRKRRQRGRVTTELEQGLYKRLLKMQSDGEITDLEFQPDPIILAYRCTYRPDATCIDVSTGRRQYWEAKNHWVKIKDDGGWVKLKVAAQMYKDTADFWLYEQTKNGQIVITQIPTR